MYQVDNRNVLFDWLQREPDVTRRQTMLDWMVELADDPLRDAHRIPGIRAPVYLRLTALDNVALKFLHAEQFHVVRLIELGPLL